MNKKDKIALGLGIIYVFFNSFLLPNGFYYTMILFPFFLTHSIVSNRMNGYWVFMLFFIIFLAAHFNPNLSLQSYLQSSVLSLLNIGFMSQTYYYLKQSSADQISKLFQRLTYFNILLTLIACVGLFIPLLKPALWYILPITIGSGDVARLKLFQTEASVYSLIITPLSLYYFFTFLKSRNLFNFNFIFIIIVPLALSFSLGVILALLLSVIAAIVFYFNTLKGYLFSRKNTQRFALMSIAFLLWIFLDKHNLLLLRVGNILMGKDTSANGRTIESFVIAKNFLNQYDCWVWGIGPGQFKFLGKELLLNFYKYSGNVSAIRIPNACADTLVVYGVVGISLRIIAEIVFFFSTKVYLNYYRFTLFVFLFIYQFTGSYYNNLIEWICWIVVFSGAFKQFDYSKKNKIEHGT